jgi:MFS family permease
MTTIADRSEAPPERPQWAVFTAVCAAYLAVSIGESILAPVFPVAAEELGLDLASGGIAFGLLAGSIAVGNVAGGYLLARRGPKTAILTALAVAGAGSLLAATAGSAVPFFAAQSLLGLGAGLFFAPGINVVGTVGGARRGLAMALFGVAFSAALTVAAVLASFGARVGWRLPFTVGAVLAGVAAAVVALSALPRRRLGPTGGQRKRLRDAIGLAAVVGSAGALVQYGTVAFFPAFAVESWDLSPGKAALALAVARLVSVPGKMITGHWADHLGTIPTARRVGAVLAVSGAWWTLVPGPEASVAAAVVFAAAASSVFPIANLLAFQGFGDRGPLLGTFRSVQMGIGALGSMAIGGVASVVGLRATLALSATVVPAGMLLLGRRARAEARALRAAEVGP